MGTLFVVATPIGNLQDVSARAIKTLRNVSYIACEDTRRTAILLKTFAIDASDKTLLSYYEHNEEQRIPGIINLLKNGWDVALVSDAGSPSISDPGFELVRSCIEENIKVVSIPGPSALLAALSVSGLPTDAFLFLGYLPKRAGNRKTFLETVHNLIILEKRFHPTVIFFEAPHKFLRTLDQIEEVFGDIQLVICRELTKLHEEVRRERISQARTHFAKTAPRGEFVLLFNLYVQQEWFPFSQ